MDTWRSWELVLPALERRHDVLALTLAGHAGGPTVDAGADASRLADFVAAAMDDAGWRTAHIAGNSLGGWLALQLAARGRARSVVAFAPAGGWARGDASFVGTLRRQAATHEQLRHSASQADLLLRTREGRRRATRLTTTNFEHIPVELLAHQMTAAARCDAATMIASAETAPWDLDAARIDCPVRIVWGTGDALLPWPAAAARFRDDWLPHADWVELDGIGHCPQLDVPVEAAELILGLTSRG
jgi:pimeloyl-ACP methyl ester carboxylesterase